jgi:hypothetical protein
MVREGCTYLIITSLNLGVYNCSYIVMLHCKECVCRDIVLSSAYSAVAESVGKGKFPVAETQACFLTNLFSCMYV